MTNEFMNARDKETFDKLVIKEKELQLEYMRLENLNKTAELIRCGIPSWIVYGKEIQGVQGMIGDITKSPKTTSVDC